MKLGDIIREYRQTHGLSMGEFATLSGLSKPYISMLESNKNSRDGKPIVPSIGTLLKAAKAMNISLNEILSMLGENQRINLAPEINEKQTELIKGYNELNADGQILLMGMLNLLRESHGKKVAVN